MTRPPRSSLASRLAGLLAGALVAGLLGAVLPAASAEAATTSTPRRIVSGWMPYWTTAASTQSVVDNKDLFSDVSPFWYTVDGPTTLTQQVLEANRTTAMTALAAAGIEVYPSFTDGTGRLGLQSILLDTTNRAQLVSSLVSLAVSQGYAGVDLDLEGFAFTDGRASWPTTRPLWVAFVNQLAAALHAQGKKLSVTTPPIYNSLRDTTSGYWVYDWAGIAASIDRLRIMTYDYSVSGGNIAPFPWVEKVVQYAVTQVPSGKVQVGVAAYGRNAYKSVVGTCPSFMPSDWNKVVSFTADGVATALPLSGPRTTAYGSTTVARTQATRTWSTTYQEYSFTYKITYSGTDAAGAATSCTTTRSGWYDEARAANARAALVGKYRLLGIAQWTLGGEDATQWSGLRTYAGTIAPSATVVGVVASAATPYNRAASVRALARADGVAVVGAGATLYARRTGTSTWTAVATGLTSSTGSVSFAPVVLAGMDWKVRISGAWDRYTGIGYGATKVQTLPLLTMSATSVKGGTPVTASLRLYPKLKGQLVVRQVLSRGVWVTAASATADAYGRVSFRFVPISSGTTYHYRFVAATVGQVVGNRVYVDVSTHS